MINSQTADDIRVAYVELLKRVWTDEAFGARLDSDPRAALAEIGGSLPDDVEIKVLRDTDTVKHLPIPAAVPGADLSDEELVETYRGKPAGGVEFKVVRDTETVKHLHIPVAPSEGEVSDAELLGAQAGGPLFSVVSPYYFLSYKDDPVVSLPPELRG